MAGLNLVKKGYEVRASVTSRACRIIFLVNTSDLGGFYSRVVRSCDCSRLPVQLPAIAFQMAVGQEGKEYRLRQLFGFVKLCELKILESNKSHELR